MSDNPADDYSYPCSKCGKEINEGDRVIGVGKMAGRLISKPAGHVIWHSEIGMDVFHAECDD